MMNVKAGIVSFIVSSLGSGLVLAAGVFNGADQNRDVALPAYDGVGLLVPQAADDSQFGSINELNDSGVASSGRYKSRGISRYSSTAYENSVRPAPAASTDKPWGIAILAIAGLIGGLGVAALGGWRRWKLQSKDRSSISKVLLANLNQSKHRDEELQTVPERQADPARRAA